MHRTRTAPGTAVSEGRAAVAAALVGRGAAAAADAGALVDASIAERVAALFASTPAGRAVQGDAASRLRAHVRAAAVRQALLDREAGLVVRALAADGIDAVVLKGAHLAHVVYPHAWMRPRSDTDLLIPPETRGASERALARLGYAASPHVRGDVILGQFHLERVAPSGARHALDLHWRLAAPLIADEVLPAREVIAAARPLPALGDRAKGPALHHALALACLHLAAHHWPAPDLLWLMDVRLLASALDEGGAVAFVEGAAKRRYRCLASAVLRAAHAELPDTALNALDRRLDAWHAGEEPSAYLIAPRRTPASDLAFDVRLAGPRAGARLVREHLFPSRLYMRGTFGDRPIALAYAARAWRGARRWLAGE